MEEEQLITGKAIFYGNGINLISGGLEWSKLFDEKGGKSYSFISSNTFRYEACYFDGQITPYKDDMPSQETTEFEIKGYLAKKIKEKNKSNDIYELLADLPFAEYITTNYDHALEETLINKGYKIVNGKEKPEKTKAEITYSIYRQVILRKGNLMKRVWHMHGDVDKPRSMQLGYDHYCKALSTICSYVNAEFAPVKNDSIEKSQKLADLREGLRPVNSWIDILFAYDVYFVGYGLCFDEIDIWWILNKRQRYLRERKLENLGNIYFYELYTNDKKNTTNEKLRLLEMFGVQWKTLKIEGDVSGEDNDKYKYKVFYKAALDEIVRENRNDNLKI